MELPYLKRDMKDARCSECGVKGSLYIMEMTAQIGCKACQAKGVDPFALGPWHNKLIVVDEFDGDKIVYPFEEVTTEPATFNENFANFLKWQLEHQKVGS